MGLTRKLTKASTVEILFLFMNWEQKIIKGYFLI